MWKQDHQVLYTRWSDFFDLWISKRSYRARLFCCCEVLVKISWFLSSFEWILPFSPKTTWAEIYILDHLVVHTGPSNISLRCIPDHPILHIGPSKILHCGLVLFFAHCLSCLHTFLTCFLRSVRTMLLRDLGINWKRGVFGLELGYRPNSFSLRNFIGFHSPSSGRLLLVFYILFL